MVKNAKRRKDERPPYVKLYEALGVSFALNGKEAHAHECPFCGGDRFYLNTEDGRYDCKRASCHAKGMPISLA